MMRRWAVLFVVAGLVAGCRGRDPVLSAATDALKACDYGEACGKAVATARGLDPEKRESSAGLEARLLAAQVLLKAASLFPAADEAFVRAAGLESGGPVAAAGADLEALATTKGGVPELASAREVLAFLRQPVCEKLLKLDEVVTAGGRFADAAMLARLSVLGQVVASVDAGRVRVFADAARQLAGCTMSERASPAALLVQLRNAFYDAVEACPKGAGVDAGVRSSCDRAAEIAKTRPLPLPLPDAASGDLAGALLPTGRSLGIDLTPPWALVLAAGRLSLLVQSELAPGVRQVPEIALSTLIDLRSPHRVQDVRYAVHKALDGRKPLQVGNHGGLVPLAADRDALAQDLQEIFEGILAETDALPALAVRPAGLRWPIFVPVNYRIPTRALLNPVGGDGAFRADPVPADLGLGPFSLSVRVGDQDRSVALPRRGEDRGSPDLRDAYRAVLELAGPGPRSARLSVAPAVSAGLLVGVLQTVAARTQPELSNNAAAFAAAQPSRTRGVPDWLLPMPVVSIGEP